MSTGYDKKGKEIQKGSVVKFQDGMRQQYVGRIENEDGSFTPQYESVPVTSTGRITRLTSEWCNVGGVWGGKVFAKMVPLDLVEECEAEWYEAWTKTDQYRCM